MNIDLLSRRYSHSRLLERFAISSGKGSTTAYIHANVISVMGGQIFLSMNLLNTEINDSRVLKP